MKTPILNPSFRWISSAEHNADSTKFRQRQLERIAAANKARAMSDTNVKPITARKGKA